MYTAGDGIGKFDILTHSTCQVINIGNRMQAVERFYLCKNSFKETVNNDLYLGCNNLVVFIQRGIIHCTN